MIPDGVDRNETEEQNEKDEEEGSGPDVAYGLPNKDEGTKATLRKPIKYWDLFHFNEILVLLKLNRIF